MWHGTAFNSACFIHFKHRNRLTVEKLTKVVQLYANNPVFEADSNLINIMLSLDEDTET